MPSLLGLDLGEKRVGVALSDETMTIASPFKTINFQGRKQILREVREIAQDYQIQKIVVGLPLTLQGEQGVAALKVQEHIEWFRSHSSFVWVLWDERLTTQEAERMLIQADVSRARRKEVIDQIAAQRMLQSYLDHQNFNKGSHS